MYEFIILRTTPVLNGPLPGRGQLLSNYFSQNSEAFAALKAADSKLVILILYSWFSLPGLLSKLTRMT
jgi:hypothetical protein